MNVRLELLTVYGRLDPSNQLSSKYPSLICYDLLRFRFIYLFAVDSGPAVHDFPLSTIYLYK